MSWVEAVPSLFVAGVWLLAPGVLTGYALGLRGFAAWTAAPAVSTALVAVSGIVTGKLHWQWSPLTAAGLAVVPTLVILAVRTLRRRPFNAVVPTDPFPVRLAGLLGLVPAGVIGAVIVAEGFRNPGTLSQTYDAVFHYNALRWILTSGDASALTLGGLGTGDPAFYPAAWHDFGSLVVLTSDASVAVAANVTTAMIAVLVWPLGCLFLVRQIFGRSVSALAVTGVVSVAFAAFPWGLLSFGVLWPNVLAFALMPVGLGAGLSILGMTTQDTLTRGRAWFVLVATVLATGLAQPNATFGLVALLLFPALFALVMWVFRQFREGRALLAVTAPLVAAVAAVTAWRAVHSVEKITSVKEFDGWKPFESVPAAVGETLLNATNGRDPMWLLSAAVVAGMFFALRGRTTSWIPFSHAGMAALFVMSAAVQTETTYVFTGFWYNDSNRLAAMIPVTGVVLGVGGIAWSAAALRERAEAWEPNRIRNRLPSRVAVSGALGVLVLLVTTFWYQEWAIRGINVYYNATGDPVDTLVQRSEREFYHRVDRVVPDDAVVAANPWDGGALLWALTGTRVLYPHLGGGWSEAQTYLAKHLNDVASDPRVCEYLERTNVQYLLDGTQRFWISHGGNYAYPGLTRAAQRPGFEVVARQGRLKLYRITACDDALATRAPAPPDDER